MRRNLKPESTIRRTYCIRGHRDPSNQYHGFCQLESLQIFIKTGLGVLTCRQTKMSSVLRKYYLETGYMIMRQRLSSMKIGSRLVALEL